MTACAKSQNRSAGVAAAAKVLGDAVGGAIRHAEERPARQSSLKREVSLVGKVINAYLVRGLNIHPKRCMGMLADSTFHRLKQIAHGVGQVKRQLPLNFWPLATLLKMPLGVSELPSPRINLGSSAVKPPRYRSGSCSRSPSGYCRADHLLIGTEDAKFWQRA